MRGRRGGRKSGGLQAEATPTSTDLSSNQLIRVTTRPISLFVDRTVRPADPAS